MDQAVAIEEIYATAARRVDPSVGYAGELTLQEAWSLLADDALARLVDVRTQAEWSYVGVPDLSAIGREPIFAQWLLAPAMSENPNFFDEVSAQGLAPDMAAIIMCRTVNRSPKAARAMTAKGFPRCYFLLEGFEGSLDDEKHRGLRDGWKAAGLPWTQG
jgi:rhodanese-related sulfurtransferase